MNTKNNNSGNFKKKLITLLPYILIPLMIVSGITYYAGTQSKEKLEYYEIVSLFDEGKVTEYSLNLSSGALVYYVEGSEQKKTFSVPSVSLFVEDIHDGVMQHNRENPENKIKAGYVAGSTGEWLYNIVPTLLLLAVMGGLTFVMFKRMNQTMTNENNRTISFGKARIKQAKDEKRKTTFADVAGADEEKEELEEIVQFLKDTTKFDTLGARIPKGVLLVGPPGTGKTLLARAVAGEADVPFFSISGSDFVEMYVGVGASRVRDLFDQAKKNSPSIIFIDEIDAVGRHRGAGMGGGHDEREQTLNQLLVEMDGFGANEGVIVIAATNRPDILDPALLRPGRFDRQVTVNYPDTKGRTEILKVHAKGKPIAPDVDLKSIAHATVGFTGADLENLLNEAALLAARRDKKAITMEEIDEAALKVQVGSEKKSHKMNEKAIKPELEVFDSGMINYAKYLIRKNMLKEPYYFNIILGNIACAQPTLLQTGVLISDLPPNSICTLGAIGNFQLQTNALALVSGYGVRVGLEDNIWYDNERTKLATNEDYLLRIHKIMDTLERPLCSSSEFRKLAGLADGFGKYGVKE